MSNSSLMNYLFKKFGVTFLSLDRIIAAIALRVDRYKDVPLGSSVPRVCAKPYYKVDIFDYSDIPAA
jgi:hypothetical protein